VEGDADGAVEALLSHYRLTAARCMQRFSQDGDLKAGAGKAPRGRK